MHLADKGIDHCDSHENKDKEYFSYFVSISDQNEMSKESFIVKKLKTPVTPSPLVPSVVNINDKLITSFKKGIKRDASLFKSFKDRKDWYAWRR